MAATQSETTDDEEHEYDNASEDFDLGRRCVLSDFKQSFQADVREASEAEGEEAVHKWSMILKDHVSFGNHKIADTTAIFNFGAATDCPNRESEHCQVPWEACYAGKSERLYGTPLAYRRRQEFIRDSLDAETFARAFLAMVDRKRNPVDTLRLSESGDFRSNADVRWANRVAQMLSEEADIDTYTYSASSYLNWELAQDFTVNASNDLEPYGDRRFMAVDSMEDIPEDAIMCPNDRDKRVLGKSADEAKKCGDCRVCVNSEGPNVAIIKH